MKAKSLTLIICLSLCLSAMAQNEHHGTGALPIDSAFYNKLPRMTVTKGAVERLPEKYSLKDYCPEVKDQGVYGTCVAWATAYAARTIAEAVLYGWKDTKQITKEAFSPMFVYAQLKSENDTYCTNGIYIVDNENGEPGALSLIRRKGVSKYDPLFDDDHCADENEITEEMKHEATHYKIDGDTAVFYSYDSDDVKIRKVKHSLSNGCPVVIGMDIPTSFNNVSTEIWNGEDQSGWHDCHAMCVIGYDDTKGKKGAFQIMNSWGTRWGDGGFIWIEYEHFCKYVYEAYEVCVEKVDDPEPYPLPTCTRSFGSTVKLQIGGDAIYSGELTSGQGMQYYKTTKSYPSGTSINIEYTNTEPAYVYAIGSDLKNNVAILKMNKGTFNIDLDDTKGTDYLCLLFSKYGLRRLQLEDIKQKIKSAEGSFYEKLQSVMSDRLAKDIDYSEDEFGFSGKTTKTVVPLIIELEHR